MWILEIIQKAFLGFITDWISGVIDSFTSFLDNVFIVSSQVVKGDFATRVTSYSLKLGMAILVFLAISQIIKLYILNESGEPEEDFLGFFIRLGKSAILMSFSTIICSMIINFSEFVANDVKSILGGTISTSAVMKKDLLEIATMGFGTALTSIIVLLVVIISLFIIGIQAGIRGVNLAVLQMTAPVFACNYVTTDKGLWKKWLQNMMSVSLTYVMQIALLNIALKYLAYGIVGNLINSLIGIAWLIVCIQSPKFLKELAYSTGVGEGISRGASSVSQVAMSISRFIK